MPHASHQQQGFPTLDTAKGSGPDDLHSFMLQILADFLVEPITALYNKSLQSGEVPQDWRKAIIRPIFKKADPEDVPNYRPVILSLFCVKYSKNYPRRLCFCFCRSLSPSQHGFRHRRSCLSNLIHQEEGVTRSLDEGHTVD